MMIEILPPTDLFVLVFPVLTEILPPTIQMIGAIAAMGDA